MNWSIGGSTNRDFFQLDIRFDTQDDNNYVNWRVFTSGNITSWTLPQLPAPFDTTKINSTLIDDPQRSTDINLKVYDYNSLNTLEDYWLLLGEGLPLEKTAKEINSKASEKTFYLGERPS